MAGTHKRATDGGLDREHADNNWPVFETFAAVNGSLADGIDKSRTSLLNGLRTLQEETLKFVDYRLERDIDTMKQYQRCRNMMDMMAMQQKWLATLSQDYFQQSVRMGKVLQEMTSGGAADFTEAAASSAAELSQRAKRSMEERASA